MHTFRFLWILTFLFTSGCSLLPEQIDQTKDWSASQFYSEAKEAMRDSDYDQAIKYYEGLEARFPFGRFATQSQLDIIYAYYKNNEPDSVTAAADRFIKLHPQNPYVDYAYYLKGLTNYNRDHSFTSRFIPSDPSQRDPGAALESFKDFEQLLLLYPGSKYADDARQRMYYLRNNLAKYQIHVARYYMKRNAYLAAANRANRVVANFQRSTVVQEALEIMVDAYTRLEMEDLANDAKRVLTLNQQKGTFNVPGRDDDESLTETIWNFFELDKN
ncbi:MAG: outer membrane protein assembly factor BamD [gamma proteobacterium endosymbiont of Lamellibrachia anaximandri]|nr:outer membrane protein assembly factor BamD [gamma proteobacterium endosymbiont of Lamellibrachia anaximandri]